jgi:hypothetical protein
MTFSHLQRNAFCNRKKPPAENHVSMTSDRTASNYGLFATFRLPLSLIMQALTPALNHAAFNGCPFPLFCGFSATFCGLPNEKRLRFLKKSKKYGYSNSCYYSHRKYSADLV